MTNLFFIIDCIYNTYATASPASESNNSIFKSGANIINESGASRSNFRLNWLHQTGLIQLKPDMHQKSFLEETNTRFWDLTNGKIKCVKEPAILIDGVSSYLKFHTG